MCASFCPQRKYFIFHRLRFALLNVRREHLLAFCAHDIITGRLYLIHTDSFLLAGQMIKYKIMMHQAHTHGC